MAGSSTSVALASTAHPRLLPHSAVWCLSEKNQGNVEKPESVQNQTYLDWKPCTHELAIVDGIDGDFGFVIVTHVLGGGGEMTPLINRKSSRQPKNMRSYLRQIRNSWLYRIHRLLRIFQSAVASVPSWQILRCYRRKFWSEKEIQLIRNIEAFKWPDGSQICFLPSLSFLDQPFFFWCVWIC